MADVIASGKKPAAVRNTAKYCTNGAKAEAFVEKKRG